MFRLLRFCQGIFLIVLIPFFINTSQAQDNESGEVLFTETFDDNARDWDVKDGQVSKAQITEGQFYIEVNGLNNDGWIAMSGANDWSKAPIFSGEYELEFTVSNVTSADTNFCIAALVNGQESTGTARIYFCQNNKRGFRLGDRRENAEYQAPDFRSGSHQIKVEVRVNRFVLFVDGQPVGEIAANGSVGGSVGFGLVDDVLGLWPELRGTDKELTASATFDNLVVRRLAEDSSNTEPILTEPYVITVEGQDFTVIPYGAWAEGSTLAMGDPNCPNAPPNELFLFEGAAGDIIDIEMQWQYYANGDFDPVTAGFAVVDIPTQTSLAVSEFVFSINPRIQYLDNFNVPNDGLYALAVYAIEGAGCLSYDIGISQEIDEFANFKGRFEDAEFVIETFDDQVPMVQVPPGCFILGSDDLSDSQNGHEVCFDNPFWIDQYEVTVGQFDALGGEAANTPSYTNPQQPRDRINWYEARDFCELRGARLPTEIEWEYAARGPENLNYPWGNDFVPVALVWDDEEIRVTTEDQLTDLSNTFSGKAPHDQAQPVGSRPGGVSWVGAYDMSGNLSEWTSTLESDYPYDPDDGREDITVEGDRIIRGGYFSASTPNTFRLARRDVGLAHLTHLTYIGFRCVRDAE